MLEQAERLFFAMKFTHWLVTMIWWAIGMKSKKNSTKTRNKSGGCIDCCAQLDGLGFGPYFLI